MAIKICGTGSYLPKHRVTNDGLGEIMGTSGEWIQTRTGMKARHLVTEETTTMMSAEAAKLAMEQANVSAEDIDLIISATI